METFVLPKDDLFPFLAACERVNRVQIPVSIGSGRYSFAPLAEAGVESVALEYLRTQIPPKKFFFRPEEVLFRFDGRCYEPVEPHPESLVLFGLHPCDLHGLAVVDHFFNRNFPDRIYWALRRNSLLIGLGCMPDNKCFCASTGTQHIDGLYDMFLWDLGDRFFVRVRTEAGHDLLHLARDLFRPDTRRDREAYLELLEKTAARLYPRPGNVRPAAGSGGSVGVRNLAGDGRGLLRLRGLFHGFAPPAPASTSWTSRTCPARAGSGCGGGIPACSATSTGWPETTISAGGAATGCATATTIRSTAT